MTGLLAPPRIATLDDAPRIRDQLAQTTLVGIDTEFHFERRYLPQLYLVQIHPDGGDRWLFDALAPEPLLACARDLIARPWIVHGGAYDLRLLQQAIGGVSDDVLDTQVAAGLLASDYPAPYGVLVDRYLGRRLAKAATLSDWSCRPLSPEQLAYAADDVGPLPTLWRALTAGLEASGRVEIARDALAEARAAALTPDPAELWRDIPGSVALSADQAGVLRELAIWRDAYGRAEDQPARTVLPDGILTELSKRRPDSIDALSLDRRMPRAIIKRAGPELIAAIHRGQAGGPVVATIRHTDAARLVAFLDLVADATGGVHNWSPRLLTPRSRLDAIAADPPVDREALGRRLGWRDALAGDVLWDALIGRVSLAVQHGVVRART